MYAGRGLWGLRNEVILFAVSIVLLWSFRLEFIHTFDDYGYVRNVVLFQKSNLALGRVGYVLIYSPLWFALKGFWGFSPLEFHHVIKALNMVFGAMTVVVVYRMASRLFEDAGVGFGSALLLLFSRDYIALTVSVHPVAPMMFFMTLGMLAFMEAARRNDGRLLAASAFSYGFSIAVYEIAVLMLPFFIVYGATVRSRVVDRNGWLMFLLTALAVFFTGPLVLHLSGRADYVNDIPRWLAKGGGDVYVGSYTLEGLAKRWDAFLFQVWPGFGSLGVPAAGVLCLLWKRNYMGLAVALSLLTPAVFFFTLGTIWPRYFMYSYLGLAIFSACFLGCAADFLSGLGPRIPRGVAYALLTLVLAAVFLHNDVGYLGELNRVSVVNEEYGMRLMGGFPDNTVFIVGDRYPILGEYLIPITGSGKTAIPNGWDWPGGNITVVVGRYLDDGRTVVVDLDAVGDGEVAGVEKLKEEYKFTRVRGRLYSIHR